jgi:hypothetical protein
MHMTWNRFYDINSNTISWLKIGTYLATFSYGTW